MNYNNRRTYSRKYQALQKVMEVKYAPVVYRALKRSVNGFVASLKDHGIEATIRKAHGHIFNEYIGKAIRRLYLDAGMVRASQVRAEMRLIESKKEAAAVTRLESNQLTSLPYGAGLIPQAQLTYKARLPFTANSSGKDNELLEKRASFGTNDELTHAIIDYLQRFLLDKSVNPISQTTKEWILRVISNGVEQGLGADEIAKEIEGSDFLRFQALRIVRTETVRATNIGAMKAAEASPFEVQKQWISAHDSRVRHLHRLVDGQVVDFNNRFTNGLMQPGDPTGTPENIINCRCVVAFIPKRDESGRLVRSQPVMATVIPTQRPGLFSRIASFLRTG